MQMVRTTTCTRATRAVPHAAATLESKAGSLTRLSAAWGLPKTLRTMASADREDRSITFKPSSLKTAHSVSTHRFSNDFHGVEAPRLEKMSVTFLRSGP